MARAKNGSNGRLEEAMALLIQNQASFVTEMAEINRRKAEMDRINAERFARIETMLLEHNRILTEHSRLLQSLTDAVRERIGFKAPQPPQ